MSENRRYQFSLLGLLGFMTACAVFFALMRVFGGGPAGVEAIAHTMNLASDTLSDEVEPYLLRSELLIRTPRGRMATVKAYQHLKVKPPEDDGADKNGQRRLFE